MSRKLGPETAKSHDARKCWSNSFYNKFMSGVGLDIGFKGDVRNAEPVLESATGIDVDYPNYDGLRLPFPDESQDYVFTSHVLEHVSNPVNSIREWFRVIKIGGHLILIVPHQLLYEKRKHLPSKWNADHKTFYIPDKLLSYIEISLMQNTWRLRHMRDNDDHFDYSIPPDKHSGGCYEIECVIQKIKKPDWELA